MGTFLDPEDHVNVSVEAKPSKDFIVADRQDADLVLVTHIRV